MTCQSLPDDRGKETPAVNPAFVIWTKKDQYPLSWINATLTEKVLLTLYGMNTFR